MHHNLILKFTIVPFLILIFGFISVGCTRANDEIKDIRSFNFSYSVGCYAYGSYDFGVRKNKDGSYTAIYRAAGVPEEKSSKFPVDRAFITDLEYMLKEANVLKWNGFHKSDKNVLDGNGFSFYIWLEDGKNISASGYESYPKGYSEGKSAIISFFQKAMKEKNIIPAEPEY